MTKTALMLMSLLFISKITGFVREVFISAYLGTTALADAYILAISIPFVIFNVLTLGVSTGVIPVYTTLLEEKSRKEADEFISNLTNVLMILVVLLVSVGFLFSQGFVKLFAGGFEGEQVALSSFFTKCVMLSSLTIIFPSVLKGYLNVNKSFIPPETVGLMMNALLIATLVFVGNTNVFLLGAGLFVANFFQYVFYIPALRSTGYRHQWVFRPKDPAIMQIVRMSLPLMIGLGVSNINIIVDKNLASLQAVGGVSTLNYAVILKMFITGIILTPISTVVYPSLSAKAATKDWKDLRKMVGDTISVTTLLLIPASVGMIVFSEEIVTLIFYRGAFKATDVVAVSSAAAFYALGIYIEGIQQILTKAFHSLKDTKTPMINGAIRIGCNMVFSIALSQVMGLNGLPLGTSLSAVVGAGLMVRKYNKVVGEVQARNHLVNIMKVLFISLLMGFACKTLYGQLVKAMDLPLALGFSIVVGMGLYLVGIGVFRVHYSHRMLKKIKDMLKSIFRIRKD